MQDLYDKTRDSNSKFVKGICPNKGGAKGKVKRAKEAAQEVWHEILREAKGNPIKLMKLSLERGAEMMLSKTEGFKLARELAPYRMAKKSQIENIGSKSGQPMNIMFNGVQLMKPNGQLAQPIKMIENVTVDLDGEPSNN